MADHPESRLSRWSRIKRGNGKAAPVAPVAPVVVAEADEGAVENIEDLSEGPLTSVHEDHAGEAGALVDGEVAGEPAEDTIDPADLQDVETLDKDSDYTPFLSNGVPELLKRAALRKLWLSDPVLANLDGLNDYDEDFSIIRAMAGAATSTVKKIGNSKGEKVAQGDDPQEDSEGEDDDAPEEIEVTAAYVDDVEVPNDDDDGTDEDPKVTAAYVDDVEGLDAEGDDDLGTGEDADIGTGEDDDLGTGEDA